jgi:nucleoside-diphosphate-sugar epimerase
VNAQASDPGRETSPFAGFPAFAVLRTGPTEGLLDAPTIPDAATDLPAGRGPETPAKNPYLDITRLLQDTGFAPAYDTERAVRDYVGWLDAGHER